MRILALGLGLLLCGTVWGQEPYRADVDLVSVTFSVRDARGTLVKDLTRDDFEVLEDGVPQKVAFFARGADVPLSLGLVVDFSGSQENFIKKHHRDLQGFLRDVLGPTDRAFLLCFGNHLRLVSDFSGEPDELVGRLKQFEDGKRGFPELGPREERELGTAFYDAIFYSITERLNRADAGRRALVLFSDGEDNSSAYNMMDAIETAQSGDVLLYAIRYTDSKKGHYNARNKYGQRVMARAAAETGGMDYDARETDVRKHFAQIGEELRSSYELAYHTTNTAQDGTFRKVVIQPKTEGLTVRSKTGYYSR